MTPLLPTEIKALILAHAEPSTLARACLGSFALLEIAGPILYDSIELVGVFQLGRFFSSFPSLSPPISAHLSLSTIRKLTIVLVPYTYQRPEVGSLSFRRFGDETSTLLLESFALMQSDSRVMFGGAWSVLDCRFFNQLSPRRVSMTMLSSVPSSIRLEGVVWPRLSILHLEHSHSIIRKDLFSIVVNSKAPAVALKLNLGTGHDTAFCMVEHLRNLSRVPAPQWTALVISKNAAAMEAVKRMLAECELGRDGTSDIRERVFLRDA